jgi:hypothetical protein
MSTPTHLDLLLVVLDLLLQHGELLVHDAVLAFKLERRLPLLR